MLSLPPDPSIPHTIIELFGIAGSGNVAFPAPGTKIALVSKVRTPVEETLYCVTGRPLKAFVVSKEISSAQELDRNITNNAQID